MNWNEFLSDGVLAFVIALVITALFYCSALAHRSSKRLSAVIEELDRLPDEIAADRSQAAPHEPGGPLLVRYQASPGWTGKSMTRGVVTFHQFTLADWHRDSVRQAIRSALEAELPGMEIHGFAAVNMLEEMES